MTRLAALPTGPTGLGTSAARVAVGPAANNNPAPSAVPAGAPPPRTPGQAPSAVQKDDPKSRLAGPGPVRIDEDLGDELDDRLVSWAKEIGIYADRLDDFRACRYGRLVMLAHPDSDDVERLLPATKWMAALFAADDYYADEADLGAVPVKLPPRLTLAISAMDHPQLTGEYAGQLRGQLKSDPVLVALESGLRSVARIAMPSQTARIRHETLAMYVVWCAEAAWRHAVELPSVWEFLASRQHNSFLPCMSLIDIVGGYELPADIYSDPRVRRAVGLAASATVIVNDIYSMDKEDASEQGDFNLPMLIAAERNCSIEEAIELSIDMHNEVVRQFDDARRNLLVIPSPELQRFLLGLRAWMGGSREWHTSTDRYAT